MIKPAQRGFPRITLFLFFLVFLGPLAFAWNLARQADTLKLDTTHQGHLLQPAPNIKSLHFLQTKDKPYVSELMLGRWWLVDVVSGPCDDACNNLGQMLDNVKVALGKNQGRVHRLTLWDTTITPTDRVGLSLHTNHTVLADQIKLHGGALSAPLSILIIDPLGQIMMIYPAEAPLKGVYSDLKKLLIASRLG